MKHCLRITLLILSAAGLGSSAWATPILWLVDGEFVDESTVSAALINKTNAVVADDSSSSDSGGLGTMDRLRSGRSWYLQVGDSNAYNFAMASGSAYTGLGGVRSFERTSAYLESCLGDGCTVSRRGVVSIGAVARLNQETLPNPEPAPFTFLALGVAAILAGRWLRYARS
jgi:hypothetical protein